MRRAIIHILVWTAYFIFVTATDYVMDGFEINLLVQIAIYLSHNILLFYTFLYCFRRFDRSSRPALIRSLGRFAGTIALFLCARYLVTEGLFVRYLGHPATSALYWFTLAMLWITRYAVIALAFHYFDSYSRKRREFEVLMKERHLQEQQKLSLENKLLRAQIDPHFLYNALNALYAKALPVSKDLGEVVLKLAEIMRYAIKPNPTSTTVPLSEELAHIRNIMDIARFRFNNKLYLELSIDGDFEHVQVVPLAFITLAENVLKHANFGNPEAPARICLHWQEPHVLIFRTWNKKRSSREFPSNGIGLANTIQRLKDHYGTACEIAVEDGVDYFDLMVRLDLPVAGTAAGQAQNLGQVLRS